MNTDREQIWDTSASRGCSSTLRSLTVPYLCSSVFICLSLAQNKDDMQRGDEQLKGRQAPPSQRAGFVEEDARHTSRLLRLDRAADAKQIPHQPLDPLPLHYRRRWLQPASRPHQQIVRQR